MGAALVKRCFMGSDDHGDVRYAGASSSARHQSRSYGAPSKNRSGSSSSGSSSSDNAASLNARRSRQLRQLELQMQQLTKHQYQQYQQQQQLAPLAPSPVDFHYGPPRSSRKSGSGTSGSASARMIASGSAASSASHTPHSMASSYSTTMSESSFVGSQSCGGGGRGSDPQPQDDEILDMVMASAGLAFHPTQQWNRNAGPPRHQPHQGHQQPPSLSTSLPAAAHHGPAYLPGSTPTRPSAITRRGSMNSFRSLLPDAYSLQEVLGTGTTSTCYRCERRADGAVFACKVIDKRRLSYSSQKRHDIAFQLRREVDVLKRVNHPNIAKLEEAFENDAYLILIMELLDGGELFDAIVEKGRFSEREAIQVARAVLSAMQYMHSLGVVHRDLKPENMLLAVGPNGEEERDADGNEVLTVKIIDFGFAKFMAGENATTTSFLGTGGYLAPEILMHHPYTSAVDMWAFGVLLYLLLCGRLPFAASTHLRPNQKITSLYRLTFPSKYWQDVSPEAKDLVQRILVLNPRKRLTAKDALNHVWLQ